MQRLGHIFLFSLCYLIFISFAHSRDNDIYLPPNSEQTALEVLYQGHEKLQNRSATSKQIIANTFVVTLGDTDEKTRQILGEPYYATSHYEHRPHLKEIWLYTKPKVFTEVKETQVFDTKTNETLLRRDTITKTCKIAHFFLTFQKGILTKIENAQEKKHGPCLVEQTYEYIK